MLSTKELMTVPIRPLVDRTYLEQVLLSRFSHGEVQQWVQKYFQPYRELMSYYRCAIMEVETKFNVLNEELSLQYDRNPIETIKTRLKSPESIMEKLSRRGYPLTVESIEKNLNDIAGVRVICSHPADIYKLSEAFLRQDDITLLERKDYIANPKPNGYRSLHLIVETPIFLHDQKRLMKVEVQFRTISMDWWASLEHKIRYKKNLPEMEYVERELYECAEISAQLDARMEKLQKIAAQATEGKGSRPFLLIENVRFARTRKGSVTTGTQQRRSPTQQSAKPLRPCWILSSKRVRHRTSATSPTPWSTWCRRSMVRSGSLRPSPVST